MGSTEVSKRATQTSQRFAEQFAAAKAQGSEASRAHIAWPGSADAAITPDRQDDPQLCQQRTQDAASGARVSQARRVTAYRVRSVAGGSALAGCTSQSGDA